MARVLIADDDPVTAQVLQYLVRAPGDDIAIRPSAESALAALRAAAQGGSPFHVLISDAVMERMSGIELIETAAREDLAKVRVLVTGHADARREGLRSEAVHAVFSKPIDAGALRAVLDRELGATTL